MAMVELGLWGSFWAGVILIVMCCFGLRGFASRALRSADPASRMLARAILIGFLAVGLNALYWQVVGQALVSLGFIDISSRRLIGSYLDVLFKGCGALSIYMHLAAWRLSLPPSERGRWTVLGMAFYPKGTGFLARALNGMGGKK